MQEKTALDLSQDLFQLMKRFQRPRVKQSSLGGMMRSEYELLVVLGIQLSGDRQVLTVTEISNLLQITPPGVTHLLNPLEQAGYIERLPDPADRRVVRIGLTGNGREVAERLIAEVQDLIVGLVQHLGEEDSKTLIHLLSKSIAFFAY
jgi:DNA-binding MarR family transcriptional regulator